MSAVAYKIDEGLWTETVLSSMLGDAKKQVLSKLFEKKVLPTNWDGYGSPPPPGRLVDMAAYLVGRLEIDDLSSAEVIALEGGGIQVELAKGQKELQVTFFPEGGIEYLRLENGRAQTEGPLVSERQLHVLRRWLD